MKEVLQANLIRNFSKEIYGRRDAFMSGIYWLCGFFMIFTAALLIKVYLMKVSAREIIEKLSEKLTENTNTLIDISSSDRTMQKLAQELNVQLRQMQKERQRFCQGDAELKKAVTNISHDLRTPLTALCGYLDLLEQEEMSEKAGWYVVQIADRTDRMKQLMEELFQYSVAASVKEMELEWLCLNSVLEESIASFYSVFVERGITPEISISNVKVERRLDRSALVRIFGNIISNALKYSDGDFFVEMSENGVIQFSNTAKGLGAVEVCRLFDRFFTVETAVKSTGLGLSIAKGLTEQMGGRIEAEYVKGRIVIRVRWD